MSLPGDSDSKVLASVRVGTKLLELVHEPRADRFTGRIVQPNATRPARFDEPEVLETVAMLRRLVGRA